MNAVRKHSRRRPRARRGVAMLLVLVALGAATVLGGTYVLSRQAAPAIGANAEAASNAKWAARSGANVAVAILQTSAPLTGDIADDQVLPKADFGLGSAHAVITNERGAPTTGGRLVVSSIGAGDGIGALDQRGVLRRTTGSATAAFDPYLREFAVYATSRLRIETSSYVAPWPTSRRGPAPFVASIGVAFAPSTMLDVGSAGSLTTARLVVSDLANPSLVSMSKSATFADGIESNVRLPTGSARVPAALTGLSLSSILPFTPLIPGATRTVNITNLGTVSVNLGSTVIFDASVSPNFSVQDLLVDFGSTVRIRGHVRILVRDDVSITDRSLIELEGENSSLELYIYDDLTVSNSVIGLTRAIANNTSRDATSVNSRVDASRIRIYLVDAHGGGDPNQTVTMSSRSMAVADIHAPAATVSMSSNSVIIGRLTGSDVRMQNTSIVFYDHSLNSGVGFDQPTSPLYDEDRHPIVKETLLAANPTAGLPALSQALANTFAKYGIDPNVDTDEGSALPSDPDARAVERVTVLPSRSTVARAIESGVPPDSFQAAVGTEQADSELAKIIAGAKGALRDRSLVSLADFKNIYDLYGPNGSVWDSKSETVVVNGLGK